MDNQGELILIVDKDVLSLNAYKGIGMYNVFSIGKLLSEYLISEFNFNRTQLTIQWLEGKLREKEPGPVFCSDIDILFEKSLDLDPLALFRRINSFTKLIILWQGEFKNGILSYGVPEHSNYRFWNYPQEIQIKGVSDAL